MKGASVMQDARRNLQPDEEILFGFKPSVAVGSHPRDEGGQSPATAPGLAGIREQAQREPQRRFNSLFHYVDVDLLQFAYRQLNEEGLWGGGGRTWSEYGLDLRANTVRLYTRLQRGRHRTLPSWRRLIAAAQGQRRPLKRAALKDRIVQRAVAEVLRAVYEPQFLSFAGRADAVRVCRDALDRLAAQVGEPRPRWIVEARIEEVGAAAGHRALVRCLQERVGDERLLDLVSAWIKAGIMDDALPAVQAAHPPRSAIASLLAHIYCHHVFDLWASRWRERHARSAVILVRDAERLVAAFLHKPGARRFLTDLRLRTAQFAPALPARCVRLVGFRRYSRDCLEAEDSSKLVPAAPAA